MAVEFQQPCGLQKCPSTPSATCSGSPPRREPWGSRGLRVDGCPPLLPLTVEDIQRDLDRRRPGQSRFTTQRQVSRRGEDPFRRDGASGDRRAGDDGTTDRAADREYRSALEDLFRVKDKFRPAHADFTYEANTAARLSRRGGAPPPRDRDPRRGRRHRPADIAK